MTTTIVRVVGDLYACLRSDDPIASALDVMCSAIGASHAIAMRTGPDLGNTLSTSHHLQSRVPPELAQLGQSDEYRQLVAACSSGSTVRITDMAPREAILGTDMYQAVLRPLDGGLAVYGLQRDGADMVVTAICRSAARDADFEDADVSLLRVALPHLVAITGIAAQMKRDRHAGNQAMDALDVVEGGVLVLDTDGRVSHVNAAAEALLVKGDRIRRSHAGIAAVDADEDLRLRRAIDAARTFDRGVDVDVKAAAAARKFQTILGRHTPGWPLVATILPGRRVTGSVRDASVVIQLRDQGTVSCLSIAALREELGLTSREARLVQELASGATLIEAASKMNISSGTARQYLKAIFLKTDVAGQADLLRVVRC